MRPDLSRSRDRVISPSEPEITRWPYRPIARWTGAAAVILCAALLSGCRQDMHDQPKYKPLSESAFFPNAQSARPLVEETVARGQLQDDPHFYTGMVDGAAVDTFPHAVTREMVDRGEERYNVFCAPCHDRAGTGRGMIVRRGYRQPPSLHDARLKAAPPGYYFDVVTNGFGVMPDYRAQVTPADRWAIIAYIRALQEADLSSAPTAEPSGVPPPSEPGSLNPGRSQEPQ